jgi:hypothetical protein
MVLRRRPRETRDAASADAITSSAGKAGQDVQDRNAADRFEAAARLAEEDPAQGARDLGALAWDSNVDPDIRLEAAQRLAEIDPAVAASAARSILADAGIGGDVRGEAARILAETGHG